MISTGLLYSLNPQAPFLNPRSLNLGEKPLHCQPNVGDPRILRVQKFHRGSIRDYGCKNNFYAPCIMTNLYNMKEKLL